MMQWMFVLVLFGLVAWPLVPSIRVWKGRIDSRPLRIRTHYDFEDKAADDGAIRVLGEGLAAGRDARLTGSVRTAEFLRLDAGSTFERLEGRPVLLGPWSGPDQPAFRAPSTAAAAASERIQASIVDGDLVIEADDTVEQALVVRGSLTVGEGARVRGSVKAHGNVFVGSNAFVDGSLFSSGSITLESGSSVSGPVVADEAVRLETGVTVGTALVPSTVAGRTIEAHSGARVFGIVHAMERGRVVE